MKIVFRFIEKCILMPIVGLAILILKGIVNILRRCNQWKRKY